MVQGASVSNSAGDAAFADAYYKEQTPILLDSSAPSVNGSQHQQPGIISTNYAPAAPSYVVTNSVVVQRTGLFANVPRPFDLDRAIFVRNVLLIVASQLLVAAAIIAIMYYIPSTYEYLIFNPWCFWAALSAELVSLIGLIVFRKHKVFGPVFLLGFTMSTGVFPHPNNILHTHTHTHTHTLSLSLSLSLTLHGERESQRSTRTYAYV
jgi:hypothetical protein